MSMMVREGRAEERFLQSVDFPTPGVPEMAILGRLRVGMAFVDEIRLQRQRFREVLVRATMREKLSLNVRPTTPVFQNLVCQNLVCEIMWRRLIVAIHVWCHQPFVLVHEI